MRVAPNKKRHFNSLTPLKGAGKKQLGEYIVFDIESNNWKDYLIGGIYDGHTFTTYDTLSKLCEGLLKYENVSVFAHFGGIFDFLFLINQWGIDRLLSCELVMRGSSVFSFKMGSITFIDSSGILPFSLESAAKAFKVSHQKLEIDHRKRKVINESLVQYLKHDCIALYEVIQKYVSAPILKDTNFKPTLASQSLEVLRKYITRPIPAINDKRLDTYVRRSYAGGRVEIYRPIYYSDKSPLYYYDFNSLYPSVMHDMDVPSDVKKVSKNITPLSFVDCIVKTPDDIYLPLLWQKHETKFVFPKGKFRGVFSGIELIEAEKQGYEIIRVFKSIEFNNLGKIFKQYINDLYYLKNNATDPVQKQISKLLLNAGYGRMAIKRDRETLCIDDGSPELTPTNIMIGDMRLAKKSNYFKGFSNAAIGSMITSHARLKLYKTMLPIQDEIYYCDTDSIVTTARLATGSNLGDLKLEDTLERDENGIYKAAFLLPKTYIFNKQVKMKGFPKEFAQSLNFDDFAMALEGDLRKFKCETLGKMSRIKSAKNNNGSILKVMNNSVRQLKAKYDKRIIIRDNNTFNSHPINAI